MDPAIWWVENGIVTSRTSYYTYTNELLASESYLRFDLGSGEQYKGRQEEYFYNEMGLCTLHYSNEQDLSSRDWFRKDRLEAAWSNEGLYEGSHSCDESY